MTKRLPPEPLPIDERAPRYAPGRSLPAHRYLPGVNERPADQPRSGLAAIVPPERLHQTELFRYGVDLFNRSYFWEAHEAWEELWQKCPEGPVRQALQGLIQLAAANLKECLGVPSGALKLSASAIEKLDAAHAKGARLGVDIPALTQRARAHFAFMKGTGEPGASSPGIRLVGI